MSVLVSSLVQDVRTLNMELTAADHPRIIRWLNHSRRELQNHPSSRFTGELGLATRLRDLSAGVDLYALPCDYIQTQSENSILVLGDDGKFLPLRKVSESFIQGFDPAVAQERLYALQDDGIRIRPIPTANVTGGMKIVYYRSYADWVTEDEVIPDIWDRWQEVIAVGATLRSAVRYEDQRTELERLYERLLGAFRTDFETRDGAPKQYLGALPRKIRKTGIFGTAG